jgi:hypothetical protein
MTFDEVQAFAAARLAAHPVTAPLGPARLYSLFEDDKASDEAIAEALRLRGVSFEISDVVCDGIDDQAARGQLADCEFAVHIAETHEVTHTPALDALCAAVIQAIRARVDQYTERPRFRSLDSGIHEHGYVLHIIKFVIRVQIA